MSNIICSNTSRRMTLEERCARLQPSFVDELSKVTHSPATLLANISFMSCSPHDVFCKLLFVEDRESRLVSISTPFATDF